MNKINSIYAVFLLTINSISFANEKSNYDFNELSYGINGSSVNSSMVLSYGHSRSLSDKHYLTAGLTQGSSSNVIDPFFFTKAGLGFGVHKSITKITDVYLEFSFSEYWLHNLEKRLALVSLKSGSITDISNNIQFVTELTLNKNLNKKENKLDYFNQQPKKIDFQVSGLFKLKNKNQIVVGASSTKGFPYFGFKFK